jgi:hypothetical protein
MKLTRIRCKGKKIHNDLMHVIGKHLRVTLKNAGFITEYYVINSSRIDLKLRMRSFKIDIGKLGYNASYNPHTEYKVGYRRTCTPTWQQRVDYNNIVNEVLDSFNVSCNIVSGCYTIREGLESMDEYDWQDQKPMWQYHNENRGIYIAKLPWQATPLGKVMGG